MRKVNLIFVMVCFSAILSAQTENAFKYEVKARGGVTVGMNGTYAGSVFTVNPNSKIHLVDSITYNSIIAPTDYRVYHGSDTLIPYIPVAGQTAGIALADSTGSLEGNYMTRQNYLNDINNDNFIKAYNGFGGAIKALPLMSPMASATTYTLLDREVFYTLFYLPETKTLTGVKGELSTAGVFNADQFNGVALFKWDGNVTFDQVAISANDTLFLETTAATVYTVPFTAPYAATAGYYMVGLIHNKKAVGTASVHRAFAEGATNNSFNLMLPNALDLHGYVSTKNAFEASETASDIVTYQSGLYLILY